MNTCVGCGVEYLGDDERTACTECFDVAHDEWLLLKP